MKKPFHLVTCQLIWQQLLSERLFPPRTALKVSFTMMLIAFLIATAFSFSGVAFTQEPDARSTSALLRSDRAETYFQYSIWGAFVNRVFDGKFTIAELKSRGNVGLGSFNRLDGEMVMLDSTVYKVNENGLVTVSAEDELMVYANAAFFEEDYSFEIPSVASFEMFRQILGDRLPSRNYFYAFKVSGDFKKMKCGGLAKQSPPYTEGLDVLIPNRPIYEREDFKGTLVGFFCPAFIGDINVAGFHFHFISDDKKFGGHVMEFEAANLKVSLDEMRQYDFMLPESSDFPQVQFDKTFQYKQK